MTIPAYPLDATQVLDVRAPIGFVYAQWAQVEQWAHPTQSFEDVRRIDDERLMVRSMRGTGTMEWEAVIAEQVPEQHIRLESLPDAAWYAEVSFEKLDEELTRVALHIHDAPGVAGPEHTTLMLRMHYRLAADLRGFRQHIEDRYREQGQQP
jgi:uncharacterized membrane protein